MSRTSNRITAVGDAHVTLKSTSEIFLCFFLRKKITKNLNSQFKYTAWNLTITRSLPFSRTCLLYRQEYANYYAQRSMYADIKRMKPHISQFAPFSVSHLHKCVYQDWNLQLLYTMKNLTIPRPTYFSLFSDTVHTFCTWFWLISICFREKSLREHIRKKKLTTYQRLETSHCPVQINLFFLGNRTGITKISNLRL